MRALPPLAPSGPPASSDRVAQMRQAATAFEAMAIGEMLKPMFESVDTSSGPFGGGAGEAAWRPMLVETIGKQMAEHGGIGLADAIFRALVQNQETKAETTR
ncbi:MAG: rod-binding protein [Acetobacteraceae bacterium]|nr:rod-binding protein [Acetobacteraceae bacterium]